MGSDNNERFEGIVRDVTDEDRQKIISRVEEMDLPDLRDNELIDDLPSSRDKESVRIVTDNSVLESHAFKALMRKGMANFTFLEKIVFQLQIIFLRKNQAELFRTYYLKELEQEVLASGNFANFETKTLTARFANELFELYKAVSTVKAPLDLLWQNKKSLHTVITDLLAQGSTTIKRNLEDFVPVDQLLAIFIENNNSDEAVRRHILKSVKSYTDSLSNIRMKEIRSDLLPLFYLHKLASYPFLEVFKLFGVSPTQLLDSDQGTPNFKNNVPISILLDYLMKLDVTLTWAAHLTVSDGVIRYFYREFYIQEAQKSIDSSPSSDDITLQVNEASREFEAILARINRSHSRLPIAKMIQIFTQNPIYTVGQLSPKLDVRQFYSDTFKSIAISELDKVLVQMRIAYFKQMLTHFFAKTGYLTTEFYINNFNNQWQALGLPEFRHTQSFQVVYNFLRQWMPAKMHNILAIMIANILTKTPSLQQQMEEFKISLDLAEDKLKKFDKSLSFEQEAGKLLLGFKDSMNSNSLKRAKEITNFMVNQDAEVLSFIEGSLHLLESLANFLKNKIIDGPSDSLKPIIASVYGGISRSQSLQEVLRSRSEDLFLFVSIIREVIRYEKDGISIDGLVSRTESEGK
ncbi:hypothetical protein [Entomospira culicis]|uniref:Uncharacterized protein n=1 Tax=Entomospira culicis TaxID=2719989 RepID=A0A968GG02_9SPIO|nr:hypothetical protein [Entomospira culicis]NIZ19483.1 hypothetical protein [Entomospira culicis]NIZ69612.1 hypothetical protein [Entomospira culicis]WDI36723.1 hypothetical protein PVA46_05200 [Entomospira culicis]WDI38352.1 hypothetical protein PVA47_05210 [Entomospira culicis]